MRMGNIRGFTLSVFFAFLIMLATVTSQSCKTGADTSPIGDCDGTVNSTELMSYISEWYKCSSCVPDLFQAIEAYYGIYTTPIPGFPTDYISWWKFDGDANDEIGVNNGALVGGVYVYDSARNYSADTNGYVLKLDGEGDWVDVGSDASLNITNSITISAWINPSDLSSGPGYQFIVAKGTAYSSGGAYTLATHTNDLLFFIRASDDSTYDYGANYDNLDFNWHHVVGVFNGTDIYVHVDGILGNRIVGFTGTINDNTNSVGIGATDTAYKPFNGSIDEVMIYDRALTEAEIYQIYLAQGGLACTHDPGCSGTDPFCFGNMLHTCSYGGDGCLDIDTGTDCTLTGELCSGGECVPDVCGGVNDCSYYNGTNQSTCEENVCFHCVWNFSLSTCEDFCTIVNFCSDYDDSVDCDFNTCGLSVIGGCTWNVDVCEEVCAEIFTCGNYGDIGSCESNTCQVGATGCRWNVNVCEDAVCGDGLIEGNEECDDNDVSSGDGCSASCEIESGWWCMLEPSDCSLLSWVAPIGIPYPSFGIGETYRMYDEPANRNPALSYTQNAEGGYYTHYVDKDDSNATNTNNIFGTAAKPRLTMPASPLPAGSVVEVHGGPFDGTPYAMPSHITGFGTRVMPIFIRGVATGGKNPFFNPGFRVGGTYLIFEGMSGSGCLIMEEDGQDVDTEYVSVRNCDFFSLDETGGKLGIHGAYTEADETKMAANCVIYNNVMHDFGDMDYIGDSDMGGINVGHLSRYSWVVDNEVYRTTATGIGVRSKSAEYAYIGRNHIHHTRQGGIWTKYGTNIVYSQNRIHDIYPTYPNGGQPSSGMGYQYHPINVWYIFNEVYNCTKGFSGSSPNGDEPVYAYLIGNLIYNQKLYPDGDPDADHYAIGWSGNGYKYAIGNTIYNWSFGSGMHFVYPQEYNIINNIVADVKSIDDAYEPFKHLFISFNVAPNSTLENNLFYQSNGPVVINWGSQIFNDMDDLRAGTSTGEGCMVADPQFVDAANGDFHLQSTSPAIDNGTLSDVYQTFYDTFGVDIKKGIEGRTRPQDGDKNGTAEWDIGPFEYG